MGLALLFGLVAGCTGGESDDNGPTPSATYLLVQGEGGQCPTFADAATAFDVFSSTLRAGDADVVGLAEARIVEECSGAGGTHVFSSPTDDGKRFWLGSHACWLDVENEGLDAGVIVGLGVQTAGLFQGSEGWCMNYPGENSVFSTDIATNAMAWFASEAEARRFLQAL